MPMVVNRNSTMAQRPWALAGGTERPTAAAVSHVKLLGNAQSCAPSVSVITIVINSTILLWTWMLLMLKGGAALSAGRRCFFSVVPLIVDCVDLIRVVMDMLLAWFPSAFFPRGLVWPLGATSSSSRTMMCPVGRAPLGDGQSTGAPRTCSTGTSSAAVWTTLVQSLGQASMATWSPTSSRGAMLTTPSLHPLLRSVGGRLPAHVDNGGTCAAALARASSP